MRFPPAWYPDPTARHDHRWWDGAEWTAHVADAGAVSRDPIAAAGSGGPSRPDPTRDGRRAGDPTDGTPRAASVALGLGVAALLTGAIPFLGLLVAAAAMVVGIRIRRRTGPGAGRGLATGGVAAAALGGVTAVATTLVAVMLLVEGFGGGIGAATRTYAACLEERPQEVCQREFSRELVELLGG
jgi:hypothetical protein